MMLWSLLKNSFLIFLTPKFDYSLRKQVYYNKKVYCIDNGKLRENMCS